MIGPATRFETCGARRGAPATADELLREIADADWRTAELCERVRTLRAEGDEDAAREAKLELPAVAWPGVYRNGRRREVDFLAPSGLVPIDLDDADADDVAALDGWPHLHARWTSAGGRVHGLARVEVEAPGQYRAAAETVRSGLEELGLAPDASWDPARLLFLSASPVAYGESRPLKPRPPPAARRPRRRTRSPASQQAFAEKQARRGAWGGVASGVSRRLASADRDRVIAALRSEGTTLREIGERLGLTAEGVRRVLAR